MLVFCYPLYKKKLHLNHTGEHLIFATDEIVKLLNKKGHSVDVVSLAESVPNTLMRSKIRAKTIDEVDINDYDMYYHAFRDPTQPEVIKMMNELGLLNWDYNGKKIINHIKYLKNHNKWEYIPILHMNGIGPKVYSEMSYSDSEWGVMSYGSVVSKNKKYIRTCAYNNNREEYPDRKNAFFTEYIDGSAGGIRSFFRIGYSMGKCGVGWLYAGSEEMDTQKGGGCKHKVPYSLPSEYAGKIEVVLDDLGIDFCHFEGMFKDNKMYIFDINPYPTSHGQTLTAISDNVVNNIITYGNW